MLKLDSCIKANKSRHYTGVGVLIVTKYLNKPCIVLGLEKNKSKKISDKFSNLLNNKELLNNSTRKTSIKTNIINPDIKTNINNPDIINPDIKTIITNPDIINHDIINHDIINPDIKTNITNPDIINNKEQLKVKKPNHNKHNQKPKRESNIKKNIFIYEEFGGGIQDNNLSLEENACFELCEETSNLLNFTNPFILNKGVNTFFDIPYLKDRLYRLYVVYIEDFTKDIHLFYKNKQVLKSNPSNYFKYRNFTEVSDITFLEIDNISKYIENYNNYMTVNSEELLYNQINKDKGVNKYKGILKCIDNIFLSKRLVDFLNMNFIYDKNSKGYIYYNDKVDEKVNKELYNKFNKIVKNYKPYTIRGLDFCKYIFKQGTNINMDSTNFINLTKPRKNNKNSIKYNFLNHTYSIDGF